MKEKQVVMQNTIPASLPPSLPVWRSNAPPSHSLISPQHRNLNPHPPWHPRQRSLRISLLHPPHPRLPRSLPLPFPRPQHLLSCSCPVSLQQTSPNRRSRGPPSIRPKSLRPKIVNKSTFSELLAGLTHQGGREGGREGAEDDCEAVTP